MNGYSHNFFYNGHIYSRFLLVYINQHKKMVTKKDAMKIENIVHAPGMQSFPFK